MVGHEKEEEKKMLHFSISSCRSRSKSILQEGPSRYGIESNPALVYYEKEVPAVFEGDLDVTDSGILSLCKNTLSLNFNILYGSIRDCISNYTQTAFKNLVFSD